MTEDQKQLIEGMEKVIRKKFEGETYQEAQKYIDDNLNMFLSLSDTLISCHADSVQGSAKRLEWL